MTDFDLTHLTPAEKLWLWRRRQVSPTGRGDGGERRVGTGQRGSAPGAGGRGGGRMSANEAAALLGVPVAAYCDAERGPVSGQVAEALQEAGVRHTRPTPAEACALARRRTGAEVEELCRALGGISKPTFFTREREAHPDVVDMWRARGFTF